MKYKHFMFVCTGNTCRSPMAAAVFKKLADEHCNYITTDSCGTAAANDSPATKNAVLACAEIGIDLRNFKSKPLDKADKSKVDLYVVMTFEHAAVLMQKGIDRKNIYVFNDVADPYGGDLEIYRLTRNQILSECITLFKAVEQKNADNTDE